MKSPSDLAWPALMLVTGRELLPGRTEGDRRSRLAAVVAAAIAGGATLVQVREKDLDVDQKVKLCLQIRSSGSAGTPLVVNGSPSMLRHPDFSLAADGIHLPEASGIPDANDRIGANQRAGRDRTSRRGFLLGRSVHSEAAARQAGVDGFDYVVAGPVYETGTHPGLEGRGLTFLERVCRAASTPVIAIGGIQPAHVQGCLEAGAAGIAVRSSILCSPEPAAAAKQYAVELKKAGSSTPFRRDLP
ncbi:MAG: thiamine phosphate synthase [Chloroflexi bacterium]|nr:thiamine phosphate synthase [Chloroflexota bacterium]